MGSDLLIQEASLLSTSFPIDSIGTQAYSALQCLAQTELRVRMSQFSVQYPWVR